MKSFLRGKYACLAIAGIVSQQVFSAVDAPYEVGTWANFCQGAISHTFDDNMNTNATAPEQAIFNDKKFHITLFVQTSNTNWSNNKASFAKGHEIASHSVSHGNPSPSSEFSTSQKAIQQNVPGEKCVSYAYPNCKDPGGATQVFVAARTCESGTPNSKTPSDFGSIQSKGFGAGSGNYTNDATGLNNYANAAATANGWGVGLHHGIGSQSHSWATTNLKAMTDHLDYLDKNRDKIWMETFGNVARYIKERNAASVTKKDSTDKGITLTVTDNLADSIFNYPLTIRRPLPADWTTAVVSQKDKPVEDTIVEVSGKKYVMFNVVPDGGDVLISKNSTGIVGQRGSITSHRTISFVNSKLIIPTDGFSGAKVVVTLFDLDGKVLGRHTLDKHMSSIALPSKISNSAFVAKATDGTTTMVERFVAQN